MRADLERFMENNRWTNPKSPLSYLQCKAIHLNGVQTRLKCKPNVKRCKRFVFPSHSPLLHHNALTTKAISHFQADHILTRFVFPPLYGMQITTLIATSITTIRWQKPYTTLAQWVSRCHQAIPLQDSPQQGKTSPILLLNITENGIVAFQDGTSIADQTRLEEQFSSLWRENEYHQEDTYRQ